MVAGRRGFIRTASGLLVLGTGNFLLPRPAAALGEPGVAPGKYGLELDGVKAGWVWSVEGGHAVTGAGEALTITSNDPDARLLEWMKPGARRDGALIDAATGERIEFTGALITEFGLPALDARGKDPLYLSVKFTADRTRRVAGKPLKPPPIAQTQFRPENFRFTIDGLDKACARVSKVDALTIKQKVTENPADRAREPGKIDIPNLVITLPESDEFAAWLKAYRARQAGPRAGSLTLLAGAAEPGLLGNDGPDLARATRSLRIDMNSIRPLKLSPDKVESGSEQLRGTTREEVERLAAEPVRRVKVEMYCEDFRLALST